MLCFCSYQANISLEKASARLSSSSPAPALPGILATAGTADTVPELVLPGIGCPAAKPLGLVGNSGGTLSLDVEDLWLPDPADLGLSEPPSFGESLSADLRLLALAFRNLVEYL